MYSQGSLLWTSQLFPDSRPRVVPSAVMASASQKQLKEMMHGETGKLLELREELEKEMERITEDYV